MNTDSIRFYPDANSRVGRKGQIWYDPESNTLKVSDGYTPGGQAIKSGETYAIFYDDRTQYIDSVGTQPLYVANAESFNKPSQFSLVDFDIRDQNKIEFRRSGIYELTCRLQLTNYRPYPQNLYIWLRKNKNNISNSSAVVTIPGSSVVGDVDYVEANANANIFSTSFSSVSYISPVHQTVCLPFVFDFDVTEEEVSFTELTLNSSVSIAEGSIITQYTSNVANVANIVAMASVNDSITTSNKVNVTVISGSFNSALSSNITVNNVYAYANLTITNVRNFDIAGDYLQIMAFADYSNDIGYTVSNVSANIRIGTISSTMNSLPYWASSSISIPKSPGVEVTIRKVNV